MYQNPIEVGKYLQRLWFRYIYLCKSIVVLPVLKGVIVKAQAPAVVYTVEYEGFWM